MPYLFSEIKIERKIDLTGFLPLLLPLVLLFILFRKKRSPKDIILGIVFILIITFLISITFVSMGSAERKAEVIPIEVIETKKVGIYDLVILKATDATYMVNWLNEQGFKISEENISLIQEYCDQPNFYFIVNKISQETLSQKDLLEGIVTPLRITFQPEQPFYPMKLSSMNGGQTVIDVYFFSKNPVRDESNVLSIKKSRSLSGIRNVIYMSGNEEIINTVNNFFSWYLLDSFDYPAATWLRYDGNLENLQKDSYFKSDSVTCESLPQEKSVGITQDSCYEMLANSMIDPSFCDKITNQSKRDWCYIGLNNIFKDLLLCERMSCEKLVRPESGWGGRSCQGHIDKCYNNLAKQAKVPEEDKEPYLWCSDSAGDPNFYIKGSISSNEGTYMDECIDKDNLKEYFCAFNKIGSDEFRCPNGCEDGHCINKPTITILSPNGGEKWQYGKTYTIEWKSEGINKVKIYLQNWEGVPIAGDDYKSCVIADNVSASTGKYSWTIKDCPITTGDRFIVRITDIRGLYQGYSQQAETWSDSYFNIR